MPEIDLPLLEAVRGIAGDGLHMLSSGYRRRPDGSLQYDGERPGARWHAHGYFAVGMWMLADGVVRRAVLYKRRWLDPDAKVTCHSRPPDDPGLVRFCTLIIVLRLWAYVSGAMGFLHRSEVHPDLLDCGSDRTVQRWMSRAQGQALETQQAIRLAIIEKSEPRPMERLFRGGLSPPNGFHCRQWQNPPAAETLWRALAMLLVTARKLGTDVSILLAEARRRCSGQKDSFVI